MEFMVDKRILNKAEVDEGTSFGLNFLITTN